MEDLLAPKSYSIWFGAAGPVPLHAGGTERSDPALACRTGKSVGEMESVHLPKPL